MFILTEIQDLVQITPEDFEKRSIEAVEDNLNAKYSNKVIQNIGLCICVYDIEKASDGLIGHGTGIVNVNVTFRNIVFRPFKGEILLGKIGTSSEWGIKIQLDFFEDILVPPNLMFPGSYFNVEQQSWIWNNEGTDYYYDKYEWVRIRVEQEHWHDQSPVAPSERESVAATERISPYRVTIEWARLTGMIDDVLGFDDAVWYGADYLVVSGVCKGGMFWIAEKLLYGSLQMRFAAFSEV
ncbi:MAG: DNA-directed RNA polymerase III subunit rpc25 [Icmadophila ericetorum]|nr:DNA-directed RNA polymerase III subunit rpc25 [Icmadophila ericetorum]